MFDDYCEVFEDDMHWWQQMDEEAQQYYEDCIERAMDMNEERRAA